MRLIIYVNDDFEDERALFDLDEEKTLLLGDYCHDHIDEKIEGYLEALKDFKIYENDSNLETEWIDSDHKYYKLIGFCYGGM